MNSAQSAMWRRFVASLVVLAAVAFLPPAALVLCARSAFGIDHPLPSVSSASELVGWVQRELTTNEIVTVLLRSLLIVGWALWAGLMLSVLSTLLHSRPRLGHFHVPRAAVFDGFATWMVTGLTVLSSLSPKVSFAEAAIPSGYAPAALAANTSEPLPELRAEHRDGFGRVETGESIEMFAQRILGDATRWPEIWELGRGSIVDELTGATWDEAWRLEGGWQLAIPRGTPSAPGPDRADSERVRPSGTGESLRTVRPGDSYWSIAADLLDAHLDRQPTDAETSALTTALMNRNAPRLGYPDSTLLQPGDVLDLDLDIPSAEPLESDNNWIVQPGDSYWKIATETLAARHDHHPGDQQVSRFVRQLIESNAPRLGYDDATLLRPGDVIDTVGPRRPTASDSNTTPDVHGPAPSPTPNPTVPEPTVPEPTVPESRATPTTTPAAATTTPAQTEALVGEAIDLPVATTVTEPSGPDSSPSATTLYPPVPRRPARTADPVAVAPSVQSQPTDQSAPVGLLAGVTTLSAAGLAALIRRRWKENHQRLRPGYRRAPLDPTVETAVSDVLYRDVSDVTWMDHELRLLAHELAAAARSRLTVQLVQVGVDRTLEVAFTEIPDVRPPGNWEHAADRVWRLDKPHDDDLLAAIQDAPPILPALVTVGAADEGGQLYLNAEAPCGINVRGHDEDVFGWIANALWEISGEAVGEGTEVMLVADDDFDGFRLPSGVPRITEREAIARTVDLIDQPPGKQHSMLACRTATWEAWPATILVITCEMHDERWKQIASLPSLAVFSFKTMLDEGLDIEIASDRLSVPSLGIRATVASLNEDEQLIIEEVVNAFDADPIVEASPEFVDAKDSPLEDDVAADAWEAPSWPVMINVLGTPSATKNGKPIKLTPQQLSALALIAMRREIPAHDFKRAIWGDEDEVSPERVRDMLSTLRKRVGGLSVIPKREDGVVCAGPDLGCDTQIFDALAIRCQRSPHQLEERLRDMLDLVTGRLFNYSSADQVWWRWAEIAFGMTDWTTKTTTAADTLARLYLDRSDPAAARDIAERGLIADPLNAALTEVLMEAYADLGTLEAAQRVYESHDRSLDLADLGGASDETRRVLSRLRAAASERRDTAAAS